MTTTTISISRATRKGIDQLGQLMQQHEPHWADQRPTANTVVAYALGQAIQELEEAQAITAFDRTHSSA